MTISKKIVALIFSGVLIFILYQLIFGRLFPFSPFIVGFKKIELPHSIIYIQKKSDFENLERLDALVLPVADFHELQFTRKPQIIIFSDSLSFLKRSLSSARFSAYSSGRLLVSPWAVRENHQGKISLEIYIRHELSHVLIFQHKGLLGELNYPKWLLEGLAMYSANQMGTSFYPDKETTYHAIAQGNFLPPFDFETGRADKTELKVQLRIAFIYSEFSCIVDYLVEKYGKEKFLIYVKSLIKDNHHDKIFASVYGLDFDSFITEFREHVVKSDKLK